MKKKLIVVLGMHRSGTSAITRGLQVFNVSLGDHLHPAKCDNPKGFWEDEDIIQMNECILQELGSAHDRVGLVYHQVPTLDALKKKAVDILKKKMEHVNFFAIKDPRIPRLLPFWQSVFSDLDCAVAYVIALRNPLSVVASLKKRNGYSEPKSNILWLEHVISAIHYTHGQDRMIVDYDRLMNNPRNEINRIANFLCIEPLNTESLQAYLEDFLEDSLRHTQYTLQDVYKIEFIPQEVIKIYPILCACAADKIDINDDLVKEHVQKAQEWLVNNKPLLYFTFNLQDRMLLSQGEFIKELKENIITINEEMRLLKSSPWWQLKLAMQVQGFNFKKISHVYSIFYKLIRARFLHHLELKKILMQIFICKIIQMLPRKK